MPIAVYDTLTQALRDLRQRGYTQDFNLAPQCLECAALNLKLYPEQFEVREVHRFEGDSNPDDNDVLYAIESEQGVKGVLVSAYGPYSEPLEDELMRKLTVPRP